MQTSTKSALKFRPTLLAITLIAITGAVALNNAYAQNKANAQSANPAVKITNNFNNPEPVNAQFQYGTLTATTNSISATYVPITTASGTLTYENLTIPFSLYLDSQGNVQVEAGDITAVPSPLPQTDGFIAGNYVGPGGGTSELLTLSGPGVNSDGSTEWTVSASPGATGCTYPTTATFYVGPLLDNPLYSRIQKAEITSTAYSYGDEGTQTCTAPDNDWDSGSLLGFAQVGNTLTIVSYSWDGSDYSTATNQITYTLIPPS